MSHKKMLATEYVNYYIQLTENENTRKYV